MQECEGVYQNLSVIWYFIQSIMSKRRAQLIVGCLLREGSEATILTTPSLVTRGRVNESDPLGVC